MLIVRGKMKKSHRRITSIATGLIIIWAMYLYYDYIQIKKTTIAEMKKAEMEAMAEITKPKGHIGLIGKNIKYIVVKISYDDNDISYTEVFSAGATSSVFGEYDTGNITLELMLRGKVINTVKLTLRKGGNARFNVYDKKIKLQ